MKLNKHFPSWIILIGLVAGAVGCALISARSVQQYALADNEISEASGLAASRKLPGILYTHNDSGGEPIVYAINSKGMLAARVRLAGIKNRDWEDIAVGPDPGSQKQCVFVGEIGDNDAAHKSVFVYRFEEPELSDTLLVIAAPDKIEIVYEDGPRDAEALFVDPRSGDICIVSKRETEVGLYRVKYPYSLTSPNTAVKEATLPMSYVTAADISPNGKYILIKTYTGILRYKRGSSQSIAVALAGKPKELPYQPEHQGEAVAWACDGKSYFTLSESAANKPSALFQYE